jgi:hypothetical protein
VWFVADVCVVYSISPLDSYGIHIPKFVGSTQDLLAITNTVNQFEWGIFLALPSEKLPVQWTREFWADDSPFQDLDGCLIEIRAFDAAYLEIYAADPHILEGLSTKFSTKIEYDS